MKLIRSVETLVTAVGGEKMTGIGEVYLCEICGNKVKVLEAGVGTLVCCGEDMKLVEDDEQE